ncbi:amidohydrolase [Synergistaceae bacterium OttesenSCG-928-I11]|nr:amidohydrolase [Synergistaceae bacterium OttesenSCG-928-I11]
MSLEKKMLDSLGDYENEIFALNDYMAEHPEIGSREFESSKRIVELLRAYGMEVEYPFAGLPTAFRARINPGAKRRAALMAEYDALPEIGHACGHCASGSASVMAALALHDLQHELDFGIDLIGTPDEEMTGGKCYMADDGVFDGYDFAAMVHMGATTGFMSNIIALDGMLIRYRGVPAHAAGAPEKGRNALNAARLFFDAVDMMRQHVIPEARLHGYIRNGGSASNVVPEYSEIEFLSRAPMRKDLNDITEWVRECAHAAAMATRTKVEIEVLGKPFHDMYVSPPGAALITRIYGEMGLVMEERKGSGSSDVGNVDYVCPAFQTLMGIGQDLGTHTHEFGCAMTDPRTHTAIVNAAAFLLKLVAKLYADPALLESIQEAHRKYRSV